MKSADELSAELAARLHDADMARRAKRLARMAAELDAEDEREKEKGRVAPAHESWSKAQKQHNVALQQRAFQQMRLFHEDGSVVKRPPITVPCIPGGFAKECSCGKDHWGEPSQVAAPTAAPRAIEARFERLQSLALVKANELRGVNAALGLGRSSPALGHSRNGSIGPNGRHDRASSQGKSSRTNESSRVTTPQATATSRSALSPTPTASNASTAPPSKVGNVEQHGASPSAARRVPLRTVSASQTSPFANGSGVKDVREGANNAQAADAGGPLTPIRGAALGTVSIGAPPSPSTAQLLEVPKRTDSGPEVFPRREAAHATSSFGSTTGRVGPQRTIPAAAEVSSASDDEVVAK